MISVTKILLVFLLLLLAGPLIAAATGLADVGGDWRTASRTSVGLAPDPAKHEDPVIQVYGARTFGWRGAFAVHTWVATKRRGAPQYTIYEVIGWRHWHGRSPVSLRLDRHPDRRWYGAAPELYVDLRGGEADELIDRIEAAVADYPYPDSYQTWPGPNSNTFTAFIGRAVPELRLDLPPTAIGKDFLGLTTFVASTPSGTGYQFSLFGLLGLSLASEEGLELSVLGLNLGVDPLDLAIKLPGVGRLALADN
ncbi:MAG: DUF3750 domain-containing protein [Pseudomonadota bacterium]